MMAIENSTERKAQTVAAGHRENSYNKPLPSAPDIQQPGEAGDVGNGAATGHKKPPIPAAPASRKKNEVSEVTKPKDGAEPSNTYSGT